MEKLFETESDHIDTQGRALKDITNVDEWIKDDSIDEVTVSIKKDFDKKNKANEEHKLLMEALALNIESYEELALLQFNCGSDFNNGSIEGSSKKEWFEILEINNSYISQNESSGCKEENSIKRHTQSEDKNKYRNLDSQIELHKIIKLN